MKEELKNCKDLCYRYNNVLPSKVDEKKEVMEQILGKIHGNFVIGQSFWCDYGYNIEIGKNFFSIFLGNGNNNFYETSDYFEQDYSE